MSRNANSFRRGKPRFKAQPQLLVICEDTKSAKTYFEEAALYFRATAKVEFAHCGYTDPKGIIQSALRRTRHSDEVVCVIDRDDHDCANFDKAKVLVGRDAQTTLLVSYPCFEFWLLLHFGFTRAPFESANKVVQTLRTKTGMSKYAKGSASGLFKDLFPQLEEAESFAIKTLSLAVEDNEPNPSTPVHLLINRLMLLGKPIPL